jgi:hypothetical protein
MDKNHLEKLALGRKIAYLRKCILVKDLLQRYETPCTVRVRIFYVHIRPQVHCSYTAFNNMLNVINPQKKLDEIINKKR